MWNKKPTRCHLLLYLFLLYKLLNMFRANLCPSSGADDLVVFWNDTLHVSDGRSVHHQQFKTVHTATKQIQLSAC